MLSRNYFLHNRYRIIRPLGKGGFGQVYEALDDKLDSIVAIKERLARLNSDKLRRAFEREAKLLANLRHPVLPKVSDHFFEGNGQYLVMEFIEGDDLAVLLAKRQHPFSLNQVLSWADDILKALEYLHTRTEPIIHRDIKPANIKLTPDAEIFLLDFGLAKGYAGGMPIPGTSQRSSSVHGYTAAYAPLEQLNDSGTNEQSDIYSLGATLYHLLTGRVPQKSSQRYQTIELGQRDSLLAAHEINPAIPFSISLVLSQAMALSRRDRIRSAVLLRRALNEARLNLDSERARAETKPRPDESPVERKTGVRASHELQSPASDIQLSTTPAPTILSPVKFESKLPGIQRPEIFSTEAGLNLEQPQEHASQPSTPSKEISWPSQINSEAGDAQLASTIVESEGHDEEGSTALFSRDVEDATESIEREELDRQQQEELERQRLEAEAAEARAAELARVAEEQRLQKEESERRRELEEQERQRLEEARRQREAEQEAERLAEEEERQRQEREERERQEREERERREAAALRLEEEQREAARIRAEKEAQQRVEAERVRREKDEEKRQQQAREKEAARRQAEKEETERQRAAALAKEAADLAAEQAHRQAEKEKEAAAQLLLVEENRRQAKLRAAIAEPTLATRNAGTKTEETGDALETRDALQPAVDTSPAHIDGLNQQSIITGTLESHEPVKAHQPGPRRPGYAMRIAVGIMALLIIWAIIGGIRSFLNRSVQTPSLTETGKPLESSNLSPKTAESTVTNAPHEFSLKKVLSDQHGKIWSVAFSSDGRMIAAAGEDKTVRVWDALSWQLKFTLQGQQGDINSIAFSPASDLIASASSDRTISLWKTSDGTLLKTLSGHSDKVLFVAFSPDGKLLASASSDKTLRLWDTDSGAELERLEKHRNEVWSVAFSPDGSILASAGKNENVIFLYDVKNGKELISLPASDVTFLAFSPDGLHLASGHKDKAIRLWNWKTKKLIGTLSGHQDYVSSIAFAPDGKLLASASKDKTIKLWDVQSRNRSRQTLNGDTDSVESVSFSPDGQTLVSGSRDQTVRIWQ